MSGASRREDCVGASVPEPASLDVEDTLGAEVREGVKVGLALLSQRLSGPERAAYLLREAFDYEYAEIAAVICASEVNSRQLVVRGRKHLVEGRRVSGSGIDPRALLEAFTAAAQAGDLALLEAVLVSDAPPAGRPGRSRPLRPRHARARPNPMAAGSSAA
jgi:RNA polymerase sigma-70 factor (ECF subfamily)